MQVSQIFLSDVADDLSPYLNRCVEGIKRLHPTFSHTLYNNQTLREFIVTNFDDAVVAAYDKLIPYSYKSDLGRYCLLYKLGGWYFDISVSVLSQVEISDGIEFIVYRDIQNNSRSSWAVNGGVIFSKPNNPIFKTAIDTVVKHCLDEYYGITPLCPTGPTVLGHAIAMHGVNPNAVIGDLQILTPIRKKRNVAFVLPGGTIHGFAKPSSGGDLKSLGTRGTNNYNELYFSRNVYRR